VLGLRQEVRQDAAVELGLADHALLEQRLAAGVEGAVQQGEEDGGVLAQHLFGLIVERAEDDDLPEHGFRVGGHFCEKNRMTSLESKERKEGK
jgi:hypothetical protein